MNPFDKQCLPDAVNTLEEVNLFLENSDMGKIATRHPVLREQSNIKTAASVAMILSELIHLYHILHVNPVYIEHIDSYSCLPIAVERLSCY